MLFDLDGTLIDSIELILASYRHTMLTHGHGNIPDAEWMRGVGTPLRVQLARWATTPDEMEALVATYREYNLSHHDRMITIYPGVREAVSAIRTRGLRTGVVTSKNREGTARGLALVGLESDMDVLVCADDVTNPKPHPEPVERAVAALSADPATTLFVGDSIHDLHSGRAAGVLTGAVLWGPFSREELAPAEPDFWFSDPAELKAAIELG
ncbi:MAG: HAD-IA family hydrolase [Gemmatimonadota bacterium]|nr:HAD-IA family hydrolase [Gemmatimonadota bacterium]MDH4348199.1 HAD-IA family hydrolase [Gemmatimonadota bacterium]